MKQDVGMPVEDVTNATVANATKVAAGITVAAKPELSLVAAPGLLTVNTNIAAVRHSKFFVCCLTGKDPLP